MLARWSSTVIRARWLVLAAGLVLALAGAVWGSGVFESLVNGGFDDPASASAKVQQIAARLGAQSPDVVVVFQPQRHGQRPRVPGPGQCGPAGAGAPPGGGARGQLLPGRGGGRWAGIPGPHATYAAIRSPPDDTGKRAAYQSLSPSPRRARRADPGRRSHRVQRRHRRPDQARRLQRGDAGHASRAGAAGLHLRGAGSRRDAAADWHSGHPRLADHHPGCSPRSPMFRPSRSTSSRCRPGHGHRLLAADHRPIP